FDRIFEYLDQPIDIEEKADALAVGQAGDVVFDQVWFRYGEEWTLQDVSFTVATGTTTALVGETGSGKTTLGYLAARLYDVSRGRITIGGIDIRDLSFQALSDLVGVVSQETYLFHGTVRENLRFARPDATDEEIERAARAARIHDHLAGLPEGYDTVVGERGYRFSGGEKQRLAIARAVLRDPPVLLLDEATSALDVETERAVQDALDRLSEGRTTIVIAHRLSTIRDADPVVDHLARMHIHRLTRSAAPEMAGELEPALPASLVRSGLTAEQAAAADAVTELYDQVAFDFCLEEPASGSVTGVGYEIDGQ